MSAIQRFVAVWVLVMSGVSHTRAQQPQHPLVPAIKKAKASGDDKRAKELDTELWALQNLLHKQVFSTEPIDDVLERIKDLLPAIVQEADVGSLVSKWDKDKLSEYKSAKRVDVTDLIVSAIGPDEKTLKCIKDMKSKKPVSPEKMEKVLADGCH